MNRYFKFEAGSTIVIVTHNRCGRRRVIDYTAFFYMGELIEHTARRIFTNPARKQME